MTGRAPSTWPYSGVAFMNVKVYGVALYVDAPACKAELAAGQSLLTGRGLNSSTFKLNVSASCGIGGVFRGCLGGV